MSVALTVCMALCMAGQFVFVPWYLKEDWPERSNKSTVLKCTCSFLFVLTAVLAMFLGGGLNTYAMVMIVGFVFSLFGDLFLDLKRTDTTFLLGLVSFLVAHLFYMSAYINAGRAYHNNQWFTAADLCFIVILLIVMFTIQCNIDLNLGKMKIPVFCYAAVIITMLVKAVNLGLDYYNSGREHGIFVLLVLTLGALLFVVSDLILLFINFGGKNTKKMSVYNIATYFAGQVCLAVSLIWIR